MAVQTLSTAPRPQLTLWSPAGVVAEPARLKRAARRLSHCGFEVLMDPGALARHQRFAGTDEQRLAALHRVALDCPAVAMASRGGYGLMRLLDGIEWPQVARSVEQGTRWVGYSDCTFFQLAALARGLTGATRGPRDQGGFWHGPMACGDFGEAADSVDEVTQGCFLEAMAGELEAIGFRTDAGFDGLELRGRLWGGNLTAVCALLGSRHWPRMQQGLLFLEDVNVPPYGVERLLLQLHQAGVLAAQKAVVLGQFTAWKASPLDRGYTLKTVLAHVRSVCSTPILSGLPVGHVPTKVCLPQGRTTLLTVDRRQAFLIWP